MEITHLQDMQQIIGAARMGFKRLITQKIPAILVSYFYLHKATLPARLRRVVLSGIVTTAGFLFSFDKSKNQIKKGKNILN